MWPQPDHLSRWDSHVHICLGGPWACQNAHLEQDGLTSVWDTFLSRRQEYGCDIDCLAIQEEFICVFLNFHNFKRLHYYIDYDYNTIIFSLLQNI